MFKLTEMQTHNGKTNSSKEAIQKLHVVDFGNKFKDLTLGRGPKTDCSLYTDATFNLDFMVLFIHPSMKDHEIK